jgi:murein DD-endopeptidase MepM/ murein hydrolase activator NlpD
VQQGQRIGTVGNTGNAGNSTPHLHFGIFQNGVPTNPARMLNSPCPR